MYVYAVYSWCDVCRASWAEGDLVVVVATAGVCGDVVGVLVGLRRRAAGIPAPERVAVAAGEVHGEVVAVDHRDVVEVLGAADGVLSQRRRWPPGDAAGQPATAVAGLAAPATAVEVAPGAGPYPAGGACRHVDAGPLASAERETPTHRDACRPYREAAVVVDVEGGRTGTGGENREEEEEHRGGGRHCCKALGL